MLVVGDLMQLNPVGEKPVYTSQTIGEKPVYKSQTTGYAALASSSWELFSLYELKEIDSIRRPKICKHLISYKTW